VHLRHSIQQGLIDLGVILEASGASASRRGSRTATRIIEDEFPEASRCPIIVLAIEPD
jgi:hypothetical protein